MFNIFAKDQQNINLIPKKAPHEYDKNFMHWNVNDYLVYIIGKNSKGLNTSSSFKYLGVNDDLEIILEAHHTPPFYLYECLDNQFRVPKISRYHPMIVTKLYNQTLVKRNETLHYANLKESVASSKYMELLQNFKTSFHELQKEK